MGRPVMASLISGCEKLLVARQLPCFIAATGCWHAATENSAVLQFGYQPETVEDPIYSSNEMKTFCVRP